MVERNLSELFLPHIGILVNPILPQPKRGILPYMQVYPQRRYCANQGIGTVKTDANGASI